MKNLPKRDIKTITIFCLSKSHQHICAQVTSVFHLNCNKNASKQRWFFVHGNQVKKSSSKWRRYFVHRSYAEQSTSKRCRFFAHRNYIEGSTSKQRCLRWLTNLSFTGSSYREKWLTKVSNSDSAKFNYEFLDSSIWVQVTCNVSRTKWFTQISHLNSLRSDSAVTTKQTSYQSSYTFRATSIILKWEQPPGAATFSLKLFFQNTKFSGGATSF